MSPFTEDSVSAGFDITQDHDTLATQSTMSQPTENAVNTAINTPELLSMALSLLEIRDLTRALSVSKYWDQTTLSTTELRQKLFLAPEEKADEYLQWEYMGFEWEPFIVHEPASDSMPIVRLHPILVSDPTSLICLDTSKSHVSLQMVSPSTFLTQPPVTEVKIDQLVISAPYVNAHRHKFVLKREDGVTFGDVVEEMGARRDCEPSGERITAENPLRMNYKAYKIRLDRRYTRIEAYGMVAEASVWVQAARGRLEEECRNSELSVLS